MKRIITLALAAGLVVAATAPVAKAADIEISGYTVLTGQYFNDMGFQEKGPNDTNLMQRVELNMNAVASEDLWGQIRVRIPGDGTATWGNEMVVGATKNANFQLRHAFVDFTLPMAPVSIRAGYQSMMLPAYMGAVNPVLDDIAAGVVVSTDFGMIQPTFVYARLADDNAAMDLSNESDMIAVVVPVDMDMFTVTPWAAFADDVDSTQNNAYWVGVTSSINMMDNLNFGVDFLYSGLNVHGTDKNKSGFLFDLYANYSMDFATLSAFGWYASGADTKGESGVTTIGAGSWGATGGVGALWFDQGPACWSGAKMGGGAVSGTMGVGLGIADVSVVDSLNMGAHLMYVTTTDDEKAPSTILGKEGSAIELGANASYKIYDALSAGVNLYYTIPMDINATNEANAFTGGLSLRYSF